jgi:drug/metabolite transporter (DMT)-like permease
VLLADRVVPNGAREWAAVLVLGVLLTGVSTLVYVSLLRHVTAQAAGVLTFLEPVAGVLLAWALVDERPGAATLAGGVLVLASGLAVVLLEPAETRVADAPGGVGSAGE